MKNILPNHLADFFFTKEERLDGKSEIQRLNISRLTYLIYLGLPVTLVHIVIFSFSPDEAGDAETRWKSGIIYAHLTLFSVFLILGILILILRRKKMTQVKLARIIPHFIFLFLLLMGAEIAGIDQLITNAITPFLIVCLLSAMILLIPPIYSAAYYMLAFVAYYFMMNLFQANPDILLSNNVNGTTSVAIGWFLSVTLWRNNMVKFRKDMIIRKQQIELEDHNTRLKLVAKELRLANKTKDTLFSVISHDLRGPFASLDQILMLMGKSEISEKEFREMLPLLSRQAGLTNDLLENLLSWSHSNLKGAVMNPEEFRISEIAENILQLYHNQTVEKTLTITNNINPGHRVFADKSMIAAVLRNLVSNAIKFSKAGGNIELQSSLENSMVTIEIQDAGFGITAENIPLLFGEQNFTTPGTSGEKGTGLGLILCKEFVEKHGGEISVQSSPGKGSRFLFTVPAQQSK